MSRFRNSRHRRRTPRALPKAATIRRDLRRARNLVITDNDICGGDPVFRGTRIPVHLIAELVAQGSEAAELMQSYPRLTAEMLWLAPIYAAAYPLHTPKRKLPWQDHQPLRRRRKLLA